MNDLTRREFIYSATGAALGSGMIGHATLLDASPSSVPPASFGSGAPPWAGSSTPLDSVIFPKPQKISATPKNFLLDRRVSIAVPLNASKEDLFLARSLAHELGDRFDLHLKLTRIASIDNATRIILMGSIQNPLVRQYCTRFNSDWDNQLPEGYILETGGNVLLVAGSDDRGAFYGLQSLRQLAFKKDNQAQVRGVKIRDWPDKQFRGIYLFLPGRGNISYFKRFIRDYMALYKYNTLIMEMGSSMRLDSHPELNSGWIEFARDCNYSCRNYPPGAFHDVQQNSSHQDTSDGSFLEKEEVADLADWISSHKIDLVPEIASFTHSYYLLTRHRPLAAVLQNKWPDIYCAANRKCYPLVFEVYDEYIDLLKPSMIHIGHDELFLPVGLGPQCKDENIGELFGEDIKKIHDHLSARNIKTALWGDMLLESVRGTGLQKRVAPDGWVYYIPGGMSPDQVARLIPKDCLIFNWFWSNEPGRKSENAELDESALAEMGFKQVYGNFEPTITNYETRKKRSTLLGGAPSAWFATNEVGFGKNLMSTFLGCSNILWTGEVIRGADLSARTQSMLPAIRARLSGVTPPSQTEASILPVDISGKFNSSDHVLGSDLSGATAVSPMLNRIPFELKQVNGMGFIVVGTTGKSSTKLPKAVTGIPIGVAPTSLIFLHASARPASNRESFRLIWDQADTADLLGWYEIVYEDGFVTTIPIRYGVNILEWNWGARASSNDYCYGADAVPLGGEPGNRVTFFALEWINPRLGKVIREVHLKGTTGFRGGSSDYNNEWGPVIGDNAILLKAISFVKKRGPERKLLVS